MHSEPGDRFLQHFNRALKITIFSFIHTGFAIMQPLLAGGLEVNPLFHQCWSKLLSASSEPNREEPHLSLGRKCSSWFCICAFVYFKYCTQILCVTSETIITNHFKYNVHYVQRTNVFFTVQHFFLKYKSCPFVHVITNKVQCYVLCFKSADLYLF